MDIRARIDEIVNKVKGDPDIAAKFQKDPDKDGRGDHRRGPAGRCDKADR